MNSINEPRKDEFAENGKMRKCKFSDNDLDDLREYVDSVSFNLGRAYQHAKDRSRKQTQRNMMRKKIHQF